MTSPPTETKRLLTRARDALNEFARAPAAFGGTYCKICCTYEHPPDCIVSQIDAALAAPKPAPSDDWGLGDGHEEARALARPRTLDTAAPPANVEKMRVALEPFANRAAELDADRYPRRDEDVVPLSMGGGRNITMGDIRAARAALPAPPAEDGRDE